MLGKTIRPFVPKQHLLSYLEAILRVYNEYGRRDNMFKARIKILVHEIGIDEFRARVEEEWAEMKGGPVELPADELGAHRLLRAARVRGSSTGFARIRRASGRGRGIRALGADQSRSAQAAGLRDRQLVAEADGRRTGDATAEQMDAVADLADRYSFGEIRVTHEQNLLLPARRQSDLYRVVAGAWPLGLATPNIGQVTDIIACPGLDYCSLANARSIPIAQR